jgi:aryl carrier-like protein
VALTLELIRHDVADALGEEPPAVPLDENLMDHGLDSVRIMSLLERRRREHGVEADFADLAEDSAIENWVSLLEVS